MLYEYKINLEPNIIAAYSKQNLQDGKKQLREILIPNMLKNLFQKIETIDDNTLFLSNPESLEIRLTEEYEDFKDKMAMLYTKYNAVVKEFEDTGGITYSKSFLNDTKKEAKDAIKKLLRAFPELNLAADYPNNLFNKMLNKDVGHGRMYIIHGRKIEKYLDENPLSTSISAYYDSLTERIYLKAENDNGAEASRVLLTKMINGISYEHNLGKININPIFEEYKIPNAYGKVVFHFVYPNGLSPEKSKDIFDKMNKFEKINKLPFSKLDVSISAPAEEKFSADQIEDVGKEDGKFGYLANITNAAKKIMEPVINTYHTIKEVIDEKNRTNKGKE